MANSQLLLLSSRAQWSVTLKAAVASVICGLLTSNDLDGGEAHKNEATCVRLIASRGSPRRSRTAKASRISRRALKSRCAREWGGWGRLSDDGSGHYNPNPSEGPWGGGRPTLQAVRNRVHRPDTERDYRSDHEVHEGRMQTGRRSEHAGSRLKLIGAREGAA